jgi:hypothetical protein
MTFAYPYFQIQFDKNGAVFLESEVDALVSAITAAGAPSDLFIMCHGWNNNIADATDLYNALTALIKDQVHTSPQLVGRTYAVCGLLWPSMKFEDEDLIPSGAASLDSAVKTDDLKRRVDDLRSLYAASDWPAVATPAPGSFDQLKSMMDQIENRPDNQTKAVDLLRSLLPKDAASTDDASQRFFSISPDMLIEKLQKTLTPPQIMAGTGAAALATSDPFRSITVSGLGGASNFRDVLGGIKGGFLHLLNYTTYYLMKARAGDVGVKGEAPLIVKLRETCSELRIHLIGHSFGCRATAAAINALPADEKYRPDTVLLLQAAFSHNGFAEASKNPSVDRGAFRDVIANNKVRGPILITHTRADKAVGIAYPIASRINGVTAAALGDANDIFGGLGSNGTQTSTTTIEGVLGTLLPVGQPYPFATGVKSATPYNLKADPFITNHSDIRKPEVAYALREGMAAPRTP